MQKYCNLVHQQASEQGICKVGVIDFLFLLVFWQFRNAVWTYYVTGVGISQLTGKNFNSVLVQVPVSIQTNRVTRG